MDGTISYFMQHMYMICYLRSKDIIPSKHQYIKLFLI